MRISALDKEGFESDLSVMIDEALIDLYSRRMKDLGEIVADERRLSDPDGSVERRSPLCGSQVRFDVRLDANGRLAEIGHTTKACAVAAAAAGLLVREAVGCPLDEIRTVRDALKATLKGEDGKLPGGKWADLEIFIPVRMMRSRHGSALLAFEVLIAAMEQVLSGRSDSHP